jgi:hypothetical protein
MREGCGALVITARARTEASILGSEASILGSEASILGSAASILGWTDFESAAPPL